MITFDINPLTGLGPVTFGMTRAQVDDALTRLGGGPREPRSAQCDTYFDAAFQVSYDTDGRAEFIETAQHPAFRVVFEGHALHELPAETVVDLFGAIAPARWEEEQHTYTVPSHQLSFWRAVTPEPDQPADDMDGRYFLAIGAGRQGYVPA